MRNIKIYVLALSVMLLYRCDDNISELNIDPNSAVEVAPSTLLTTAQYNFYNAISGRGLNADWGLLMVQYWAQNEYAEDSRYNQDITSFNGSWSAMYASVLKELSASKNLVDAQDISDAIKTNKKNIIDVMSSQVFGILSDGFDNVPYTEAIGESSLPKYDSQEVIYKGILATLKNASESFVTGSPSFLSGDVVFNGDVRMWIKFTNSLILKYAMRVADVDLATATEYVTYASSNLISDNSEGAFFAFDPNPARANPLYINSAINNRDDYAVSEYLVTTLNAMGDPRLAKFAKLASSGDIVGMPYGLSDNDATVLKPTTSRPSDMVREATTPHSIITYYEVQFLLAEAYQRGILTGNANEAYNSAVTASMNSWGIDDTAAIDAYLANNAYDAANWKKSIGVQKWVSLYMNGLEAWSEWRRLDFPVLSVPEKAEISTIPVRFTYVLSETQSNSAELDKVTSDPSDMTTKVWWDVN
ncbi:MAG: hypothetical protein ACI9SD_001820 [Pseudohongiellaceae bacterium]|jgi:hypothetical protein